MKCAASLIVACALMVAMFLFVPTDAQAGWELYDNFDSGSVDPVRWRVSLTGGATLTVVNGKAKLVHYAPTDKISLHFPDPQSIKGVRASVKVAQATGDLSARIAGYVALTKNDEIVYQNIELRNDRVQAYLDALDMKTMETVYTLFSTKFVNPIEIVGKWFTISATYSNLNQYVYSSSGQGTCTFKMQRGILAGQSKTDLWIGTKCKDDVAIGTVYIDDVYVLR